MKCLVGLGNPGKKYEKNRHNIGFRFIDYFNKQKPKTNEKIIFLKPQDYMNNSGIEVRKTIKFYKLSITDILVICDDLDLPFGEMRFRAKGSSGGHNGLKSIIAETGLELFARIKIGIGRPEHKGQVTDHVLGDFSPEEERQLPEILATAYDKAIHWIENQG
jgi:peptidyl-tRNA hydrolase, PTH1 family